MDEKNPSESLGKEASSPEAPKSEDQKNPFGKGIKSAMYILFDEVKGTFFVLGAPGFLNDPVRAYGALKIAEKNLDDFYHQKNSLRDKLVAGVKNFQSRMNFRSFLRGN